jgi:hypothetical protein
MTKIRFKLVPQALLISACLLFTLVIAAEAQNDPNADYPNCSSLSGTVVGQTNSCGSNEGHVDRCTQTEAGKVCCTRQNADYSRTEYCCDWCRPPQSSSAASGGANESSQEASQSSQGASQSSEGAAQSTPPTPICECSKEYTNPCDTDLCCLRCALYAEARGTDSQTTTTTTNGNEITSNPCWHMINCVIDARADSDDYPDTVCEVVEQQQAQTTHITAYKCVCDVEEDNQGYCDCANNPDGIDGDDETALDNINDYLADHPAPPQCPDPPPTEYNSNGNIPAGYTEVPSDCNGIVFYYPTPATAAALQIEILEEKMDKAKKRLNKALKEEKEKKARTGKKPKW